MSALDAALWSLPILLVLLVLRMPVGLAMLVVGAAGTIYVTGSPTALLGQLKSLPYGTFASYALSIVPLFLLMGQLAARGGLSAALFRAAEAWLGHRRGGLAMAAVVACGGFGAICGSSLATAATMGQVALPELRRRGYGGGFATASLAAGGTLGILVPPSVVLVLYALLTEQSVAKLFQAALLPAGMALAGYLCVVTLYAHLVPAAGTPGPRASRSARLAALVAVWPVLAIFGLVLGGISVGWFTPTEAAAVGTLATGMAAWASGGLDREGLVDALAATATSTGMIFFILLGAALLNGFLALAQLPQATVAVIDAWGLDPWAVLVVILLVYLVLGCLMDSLSMILLTVPILFPVVMQLDFGLTPEETALWFGILVLVVVEVGLITPPVGLNLFVINGLARDVPLSRTYLAILPFVASDLIRIALLVAVPGITLALVQP